MSRMIRRALLVLSIVSIWLAGVASAASIPPAPADSHFIQDYAGVVPEETRLQIGRVQERAFNADDTPIMVVTIPSMADYGPADATIEDFARSGSEPSPRASTTASSASPAWPRRAPAASRKTRACRKTRPRIGSGARRARAR